jgi:CheY-like chemotaxis protein
LLDEAGTTSTAGLSHQRLGSARNFFTNGINHVRFYELATFRSRAVMIALTGWGQKFDKLSAHDAGFDHHLVKPVDGATLMELSASVKTGNDRQASRGGRRASASEDADERACMAISGRGHGAPKRVARTSPPTTCLRHVRFTKSSTCEPDFARSFAISLEHHGLFSLSQMA